MARVVHFEIPVDDPERASRFYEQAFGWRLASGEGGYWLATTGTEGEPGVDGALIDRTELHASPVVIIGVESVTEALAAAEQAGASVLVGRREIPAVGFSAYLRDPEGNVVGLFEPLPEEPPGA